jgi:tetratricopeptide (TPR) repeat protein
MSTLSVEVGTRLFTHLYRCLSPLESPLAIETHRTLLSETLAQPSASYQPEIVSFSIVFADDTAFVEGVPIAGPREIHAHAAALGASLARVGVGAIRLDGAVLPQDLSFGIESLRRALDNKDATLATSMPGFRLLGRVAFSSKVAVEGLRVGRGLVPPPKTLMDAPAEVRARLAELSTVLASVSRERDGALARFRRLAYGSCALIDNHEIETLACLDGLAQGPPNERLLGAALLVYAAARFVGIEPRYAADMCLTTLTLSRIGFGAGGQSADLSRLVIRETELAGAWYRPMGLMANVLDVAETSPLGVKDVGDGVGHVALIMASVALLEAAAEVARANPSSQSAIESALHALADQELGSTTPYALLATVLGVELRPLVSPIAAPHHAGLGSAPWASPGPSSEAQRPVALDLRQGRKPPPKSGTYDDVSLAGMLTSLLAQRFTGEIRLRDRFGRSHLLHIDQGNVRAVETVLTVRRIGELLVNLTGLSKSVFGSAAESAREMGLLIGEFLVSDGMVSRLDLERALEAQLLERLVAIATLPDDTQFELRSDPNPEPRSTRGTLAPTFSNLVLTLVRSTATRPYFVSMIRSLESSDLSLSQAVDASGFALTAEEASVLSHISRGKTTLMSLGRDLGPDSNATATVVLTLLLLGLLLVQGEGYVPVDAPSSKVPPPLVIDPRAAVRRPSGPLRMDPRKPAIRRIGESTASSRPPPPQPSSPARSSVKIAAAPAAELVTLLKEVETSMLRSEFANAVLLTKSALQLAPARPDLQLLLATVETLGGIGKSDDAFELADALLELNPQGERPLFCRAWLHLAVKNYAFARIDLQKLLTVNPAHQTAGLMLAELPAP